MLSIGKGVSKIFAIVFVLSLPYPLLRGQIGCKGLSGLFFCLASFLGPARVKLLIFRFRKVETM